MDVDLLDLLDIDDEESAGDVYLAGIEPRRRGRVRALVYAGLDLWCAMSGGSMELTRRIDVVLRSRLDGSLVKTIPAADPAAAAFLMDGIRRQLASLSPEEFRAAWQLD